MTDYISREAVLQVFAAKCGDCADSCLEFDGFMADCSQCLMDGAIKTIKSIPAADVREVKRGHAVLKEDGRAHCSECDWPINSRVWNFCPNCGADMREETDGR